MTYAEILTIALGVLSSLTVLVSALSTHKPRFLIFAILTSVLLFTQFSLAGALIGAAICVVSFFRNGLVLLATLNVKGFKWGNHWSLVPVSMIAYSAAWASFNDFSNFDPITLFPLAGALIQTVAVFFSNLIYTKSLLIISGAGWLTYEYISGTYGHMIGESGNIIANFVALWFLVRAARTNTPVVEPVTEAVKIITTAIPVIKEHTATLTRPIPLITQEPQPATAEMGFGELKS